MHPVLLHLHVPRASGSSLYAWFRLALGEGGVVQTNDGERVQAAISTRAEPNRPAVVSGHFRFGVHELFGGHPYQYIVLLRDPVQRVLSLFRYIRSLPAHRLHGVLKEPGMTISRFYADRMPGTGPRNGMIAQMAGILGTRVTPSAEHLEIAWGRLSSKPVMYGLTEAPAPLLARAAAFLEIEKVPAFPEVNRPARADLWGDSEADRAAIVAANSLDIAFYDRAKKALLDAPLA